MNKKIRKVLPSNKQEAYIHSLICKIYAAPSDVNNYLELSTYLIENNSPEQALELLQKAKACTNDDTSSLDYNIAICFYMLGDYQAAGKILDSMPNDDATLYQKALVAIKSGQYAKALAYAITIKKPSMRTYELIGDCWLSQGKLVEARLEYKKIEASIRSAKINFLLGVTYFPEDRAEAEKYFERSKKQDAKYFYSAKKQYNSIVNMIKK